ncbi:MAG: DUF4956 domain-containing protein [Candidatus Cloacimonetes bacterium]|nr:DUF4956 domain-containing protein [Candidatus Cloacimonadota bacterium]
MLNNIDIAQSSISINTIDLIIALILSLVLSTFVSFVYRYTHRSLNYERSFLTTIILVSPIVALVMLLIGSNLTLSLGMVGALSIIRFRTVIKDSRDMIYLFWAISIGLGCGTYNWFVISLASAILFVAILVLYYLEFGKNVHNDYVVVVSGEGEDSQKLLQQIKKVNSNTTIRSMDHNNDKWEYVFEVRVVNNDSINEHQIIKNIKELAGIQNISLLAPQLQLPV